MTTSRTDRLVAQPPALPVADTRSGPPSASLPPVAVERPPTVPSAAAARRVNKKVALLAVLAILLGGLATLYVGQSITKRVTVLAVAHQVPRGSVITDSDLTTAEVATDPALRPVKDTDRSLIVGKVALEDLSVGELVTRDQVGPSDGFVPGTMIVAVPLKDGQLPARGLAAGDEVLIIDTPGQLGLSDTAGAASAAAAPGSGDAAGVSAVVAGVGARNEGTTVTVVDVRLDSADGVAVAKLASTGRATLILLPPGK